MERCENGSKGAEHGNIIFVLFVVVVLLALGLSYAISDSGSALVSEEGGVVVKISRRISYSFDPEIEIIAKGANLDYSERVLTIVGVSNFVGTHGAKFSVVVPMIKFGGDGDLTIQIPDDNDYDVWIGDKYSLLNKVIHNSPEESESEDSPPARSFTPSG